MVVHPQLDFRFVISRKLGGTINLIMGLRPCSRWRLIGVGTVEDSPWYCLPLWCKANCQTQTKPASCTLDSNFWSLCSGEIIRKIAKYTRENNTTLERCSRRVQSDSGSDGVALSSPLSQKMETNKRIEQQIQFTNNQCACHFCGTTALAAKFGIYNKGCI